MANEPNVESVNDNAKPVCSRTVYKVVFVCMIVVVIVALAIFQWFQYTFTYENLQGYWNITGNTYLLISDKLVQIIEFSSNGSHTVLYEDTNAKFKYTSTLAAVNHSYTLTKSNDQQFTIPGSATNPFNSKIITFVVYPVIGAMRLVESGKEVARLMKDNQMSIEYLSS